MAVSTESTDEQPRIIIEFKARIQSSRNEIQTKFLLLFDELREEELRLLTKLDGIESDVIDKFNASSATLTEIILARENILGILKSNTTNTLLKNTLEMYDKEIEDITTNPAIKSTSIHLNWKLDKLGKICEMNEVVDKNFKTTFPQEKDDLIVNVNTPKLVDRVEIIRPFYQTIAPVSDSILPPKYDRLLNDINELVIDPEHFSQEAKVNDYDVIDPLTTIRPWSGKWRCPHCTYCNVSSVNRCEICTWEIPK